MIVSGNDDNGRAMILTSMLLTSMLLHPPTLLPKLPWREKEHTMTERL
jgi:hypothetical protein